MAECSGSPSVQLFAGGVAGTVATAVTCPLEVVKTRLQSSTTTTTTQGYGGGGGTVRVVAHHPHPVVQVIAQQKGFIATAQHMQRTEGFRSFFKGLPANFLGVAPGRAVYFYAYARASKELSSYGGFGVNTPCVHMLAGACAGFVNQTVTSPVWFIKTRLQLSTQNGFTVKECVLKTWRNEGIRGFYRGLSASYYGMVETMIHFALYEKLKKIIREMRHVNNNNNNDNNNDKDIAVPSNKPLDYALAAAVSKTIASLFAYPHEVARTRLRQEDHGGVRKYRWFFQTLHTVYREEGYRALYGGLRTQLVRQVFSMAVMFMVYESIVLHLCANEEEDG